MKNSDKPAAQFRPREDFPPHTYEAWRSAAEKLLKGAPFEKVLLTHTYENLTLQPIYWPSETPSGLPQSLRSANGNRWLVAQEIFASEPAAFNRELKANLRKGQSAIKLNLSQSSRSPKVGAPEDFAALFDGVDLSETPLFLHAGYSNPEHGELFKTFCDNENIDSSKLSGALTADPLGALAQDGVLPKKLAGIFDEIASFTRGSIENAPGLKTLLVNSSMYHNAGADAVTELAVALATAAVYMREMLQRDFAIDEIAPRLMFQFTVGGHFFMEIAKLRAARVLWRKMVEAFGGDAANTIFIHAETSQINKSVLDPHVNMLRATSEAMAAILGGCQSLSIGAFDAAFQTPNEFSERIARNVQTILREEAHLGRVEDPAGGSWFVESLTKEIAEKAWTLFQEIESAGGMVAALESGFVQKRCAETAEVRFKNVAQRKDKLVGVNIFPNLLETSSVEGGPGGMSWVGSQSTAPEKHPPSPLERGNIGSFAPEIDTDVSPPGAVRVEPLRQFRTAEMFESLRLAMHEFAEKTGRTPGVFLAKIGAPADYKARADFSRGFFEIAGFDVLDKGGFTKIGAAIEAALDSQAEVVVLCSANEKYAEVAAAFAKELKTKSPDVRLCLAGYPKNQIETLEQAGVDYFVYLKANAYEILAELVEKMKLV